MGLGSAVPGAGRWRGRLLPRWRIRRACSASMSGGLGIWLRGLGTRSSWYRPVRGVGGGWRGNVGSEDGGRGGLGLMNRSCIGSCWGGWWSGHGGLLRMIRLVYRRLCRRVSQGKKRIDRRLWGREWRGVYHPVQQWLAHRFWYRTQGREPLTCDENAATIEAPGGSKRLGK